jgi:UDP-N-acetylglucosamine 2-epimerase (non-hydrolysing)
MTESQARPVMLVAGARPNFMKVAPVLSELETRGVPALLVHTGQHYDDELSEAIFRDLALRQPDFHLSVGSGTHAVQTARVMESFEPVLMRCRPAWVVVVGDVNSTLACALVVAKLKFDIDCRLAHVEAGLRSHDWRMPEEVNRVLTDRLCDLLLTHSRDADCNLVREGIPVERIVFAGNVMVDVLRRQLTRARQIEMPRQLGLKPGQYVVATLHRPSNVDDAQTLEAILGGLGRISRQMPVVLPLHPRSRRRVQEFGLDHLLAGLVTLPPAGYLEMLSLTSSAAVVFTDSGGIQEETTVLGVPCVTLRKQTERPVTVSEGTNRLAPWPLSASGIRKAFDDVVESGLPETARTPEGWDGRAAVRIADALGSIR